MDEMASHGSIEESARAYQDAMKHKSASPPPTASAVAIMPPETPDIVMNDAVPEQSTVSTTL